MKRNLIPLALASVTSLCTAQSSVTLYGIVDTGFSHGSGSLSRVNRLSSGGNATSRLGFKGIEDLGGGYSASFVLDAGLLTDDGTGTASNTNNQTTGASATPAAGGQGMVFNRRSTLSLLGPWGELRMGRDLAAHYLNKLYVDPFNNIGVGAAQPLAGSAAGPSGVRVSNMIGYYLAGRKAGPYGIAQYFMGENAHSGTTTDRDGTGVAVRAGYVTDHVDVAVGAGKVSYAPTATLGDIRATNVAVRYFADSGLEFGAGYYVDRVRATVPFRARGYIASTTYTRGLHQFKAAFSRYGRDNGTHPETSKIAVGYVYSLSKRTSLYGTYAKVRNSGGAAVALNQSTTAANQASSGFDLGIRHNF